MLLGCIGDDFTGSSDLANTLAKQGMRTTLYSGIPSSAGVASSDSGVEAGVVAIKSRSIPVEDAIRQSIEALEWLCKQGCRQIFFKYCSTFDSTEKGNIGPVAEALADALDAKQVIVCPAFPGAGRSIYMGHLFVNDCLLNESGMQNHPITPMTDADIRRVMQSQCEESVGHVAYPTIQQGAEAIAEKLKHEDAAGHRFIVTDAIDDKDLIEIGKAAKQLKLITGGSGVALGLPLNFMASGDMQRKETEWEGLKGQCVVLSGSCSIATREQVHHHAQTNPVLQITADAVIDRTATVDATCEWVLQQNAIPLVYSSADPAEVAITQGKYTQATCSDALERFFSDLARQLVASGVTKIITAGGETSGAVVEALSLGSLSIGPEIDPGVPALRANDSLVLALKSGNFGSTDFFAKAADVLNAQIS